MNKWIIIFIALLSFYSCTEEALPPIIITGDVTDIDSTGAIFHAKITEFGSDENLEYGFAWDTIKKPTIYYSEKLRVSTKAHKGEIKVKANSYFLKSKTYYLRAYIKNSKVCSYGNEVKFVSQGGESPKISSISALIGNLNDTITITGNKFNTKSSVVKFDKYIAKIVKLNRDSIMLIVPTNLNKKKSEITLSTYDKIIVAKDSFELNSATIYSIDFNDATWGDQFTIKGKNFLISQPYTSVLINKEEVNFNIIDDETITVTVPDELTIYSSDITVKVNNIETESDQKFNLAPPIITDFYPKKAITASKITINGQYFNPKASHNNIYIGGVKAEIISATQNSLEVILAKQDTAIFENRNAEIILKIGENYTHSAEDKLLINDRWFRINDVPTSLASSSIHNSSSFNRNIDNRYAYSFVINDIAYIGLNKSKEFWSYDPSIDLWTKLANFPGKQRINGTGFFSKNKMYFGMGKDVSLSPSYFYDWWEYNILTDKWTQKSNFPGNSLATFRAFNTTDGCYMTNGVSHENIENYYFNHWEYITTKDEWVKARVQIASDTKNNLRGWNIIQKDNNELILGVNYETSKATQMYVINPGENSYRRMWYFLNSNWSWGSNFKIDDKLYVFAHSKNYEPPGVYSYYDATNTWTEEDIETKVISPYSISFTINNVGYSCLGTNNHLFEFDPNR